MREIQQITTNVSSSGIYFYIYCGELLFSFCTKTVTCGTNTLKSVFCTLKSVFVPHVTVLVQKLNNNLKWVSV
jgi:hypothetical protein